jgi:DNA-binding transcriptional ArsR family regulator
LEQDAFCELMRIARTDGGGEPPDEKYIRDLLEFEYALIYESSENGHYIVPGAYLRNIIRRAASGVQVITTEPDPLVSHRGVVRVQSPEGEKSLRLSLGKWKLFQALYEKRGELVTIGELRQHTKMGKRAIQNLVTRLRQGELKELNLEISNERDRGYRLVIPGGAGVHA